MRPFASTIPIEDARALLEAGVQHISRHETVRLEAAAGRVAAADLASTIFVPPFARSAMDGYAVISEDTRGASPERPVHLRIIDKVYTGSVPSQAILRGTCAQIATGAPLPEGADTVVMVEDTAIVDHDHVAIRADVAAAHNIGRQGADITPGTLVVRRGDLLNPSRLGAVAAIGCSELEVFHRPRVAILSTGNEVITPGTPLAAGQIYDVNRYTLAAVATAHGCVAEMHTPARDTLDALDAALDACASADILIFSGGSSVGDRDLLIDLVAARGGQVIFHGVAIKPGKPTLFAIVDGRPFFGMPGNPTSCLSNAYIMLVPFFRATARLPLYAPRTVSAVLGRRIVSQAGRHQFYTVRLHGDVALPAFKGSGDITSLSQADGYIEIPSDQHVVEEGSMVNVTLF
ncbi:MAG: gephyrin-like molybdotransferase Glp [Vicinamibacterales bacterium]